MRQGFSLYNSLVQRVMVAVKLSKIHATNVMAMAVLKDIKTLSVKIPAGVDTGDRVPCQEKVRPEKTGTSRRFIRSGSCIAS